MEHTDRIKNILEEPVKDKDFKVKVSISGLKTIIEANMDQSLQYRMIEDYLKFLMSYIKK